MIGGTGMLFLAALEILKQDNLTLSVVSRNGNATLSGALKGNNTIYNDILVDYSNHQEFVNKIEHSITKYGKFECAICWVHDKVNPNVIDYLASLLNAYGILTPKIRLIDVLGSETYNPINKHKDRPMQYREKYSNIIYQRVILGWMTRETVKIKFFRTSTTRWLKKHEISAGVIKSWKDPSQLENIIGELEPWDSHP